MILIIIEEYDYEISFLCVFFLMVALLCGAND